MNILDDITLSDFDLDESNIEIINDTLIITKHLWDYELSHKLQEKLVERVNLYKLEKVFIFCNHPHCFTLGRGLQKNIDFGVTLVDFNPDLKSQLAFPVHDIFRGGGLTFHYPGQLVFYPIISLETYRFKVFDFLKDILNTLKNSLENDFSITGLDTERKLLGLWKDGHKLASIGLSSRRFVSYHGLAVNLSHDDKMMRELENVFPCGIPGEVYSSLDHYQDTPKISFDDIKGSLLTKYLGLSQLQRPKLLETNQSLSSQL